MIKTSILNQNKKITVLMFSAFVFSLLVFYIIQMNNLVSGGYVLRESQQSVKNLSQENEKLESNLAGVGSLNEIEEKIAMLDFEKINKIHYVQILDGAVAAK
jgi:hypothetical protein